MLPFKVDSNTAHLGFTNWLNALWFAPNDLQKYASLNEKLKGMYMPYWTYDAKTTTQYQGERGDYYYTTEQRQVTVNGKTEMRSEQVRHTRWSYKNGTVVNTFALKRRKRLCQLKLKLLYDKILLVMSNALEI